MAITVKKKSTSKPANEEPAVYQKVGENIRAKRVGDTLYIKVKLDAEGKLSQRGGAYILAQTNRFASLEEITEEPIGMSLVVTRKRERAAKPKRKRDDDED
jgi:hypothetical protein